jgi:hypothetical protein
MSVPAKSRERLFVREICARENKENFPARIVLAYFVPAKEKRKVYPFFEK